MAEIHRNLVGGQWIDAAEVSLNINPSDTSDVVGQYAQATSVQAMSAVDAARAAFRPWAAESPQVRADILDRVGTEILARRNELADLLAREEGKTRAEASGEVNRAGQIFKYFAGQALRLEGDLLRSVRAGVDVEISREPLGVVVAITPWNFPIAIPAWKIAPALAFGNCVVFKPAELVTATAWALTDILHRAGLPPGVFNLVMGRGRTVGAALLERKEIDAVSFTGSVDTGREVGSKALAQGARLQLEMGGKNPLVVMADASLEVAVNAALDGAFFSTGQRCTASSRLIVEDAIHDRFVEQLIAAMQRQTVGDARAPDTTIGPVVNKTQLEQDLRYIALAGEEGARLIIGGEPLTRDKPGHYLSPALFIDSDNRMRVNREEIFGPVACVIRVRDYDEALEIANDTRFGLCAGICTSSLKYARHFQRASLAGMVMVNLPTAGVDYHVPFGGSRDSSYGSREQGRYAADFFTTLKTSYVNAC